MEKGCIPDWITALLLICMYINGFMFGGWLGIYGYLHKYSSFFNGWMSVFDLKEWKQYIIFLKQSFNEWRNL